MICDLGFGRMCGAVCLPGRRGPPSVARHLPDDQVEDVSWLNNALVPGETRRKEVSLNLLRPNEDLRVHFTDNASVMWSRRFTGELAERGVRRWPGPPDLEAEPLVR
jgi:hypothetical protein